MFLDDQHLYTALENSSLDYINEVNALGQNMGLSLCFYPVVFFFQEKEFFLYLLLFLSYIISLFTL